MDPRDSRDSRGNRKESVRLPLWDTSHRSQPHNHRPSSIIASARVPLFFRRGISIPPLSKLVLPFILLLLFLIPFLFWEFHVETQVYSRKWVQNEISDVYPLSGCFDPDRVSPAYNVSRSVYGSRKHQVHAGLPMRMGMDCYNFAGTIQSSPSSPSHFHYAPSHSSRSSPSQPPPPAWMPPEQRTHYHTYWRVDLASFDERQEWMLKSFFATQNTQTSRLILWSNGDLNKNPLIRKWLLKYPDSFTVREVDYDLLTQGTALSGKSMRKLQDKKAWVDGDLVRLLVLWAYGGVWVDMDSLLTRDLAPLLDQEFVTQWDCYDKYYYPFNGALMHFQRHSPYLCEAFHIMASSPPPRPGSTDWGATLYFKLWRRLVSSAVPPFSVLPWCFSDGRSCRLDNRLPDPFVSDPKNGMWTMGWGREEGGGLDNVLGKVFSVHLHNQWHKAYPKGGWVERLLLKRYNEKLDTRT